MNRMTLWKNLSHSCFFTIARNGWRFGIYFVVVLSTFFAACDKAVAADTFKNYVLAAKGYDMEIVLIKNDTLNPGSQDLVVFGAYDEAGTLLASVDKTGEIFDGNLFRIELSELFPSIQNPGDIGFIEVSVGNKIDGWVIYKSGDQRAMVPAPIDGSAEVYNLHFTNNGEYWNFLNNVARIDDRESVVTGTVYPRLEAFAFDGMANGYGFVMPDLNTGRSSASFNMKNLFGGLVPADATWMQIKSELVQQKEKGGNVSPVDNLVNNTVFMKVNGESGGAFGNIPAFEELIVPHIAADGYYWWTGLVLNNPWNETVKFFIRYYDSSGVHLDADPGNAGIDDFESELPPFGKQVDLIQNFGMPTGAGFAEILAEKPIMGGELFGGEPGGANWPIMGGVALLLPDTGGYLNSVDGGVPPRHVCCIPLADSKDAGESEAGIWTGLAFVNLGSEEQKLVLEYRTETGEIVGTQQYTVNSTSKQAATVGSLLKSAGLDNIRGQVRQIIVYGCEATAPVSENREVMMYALQGGLKQVDGNEIHNWMIGEDAANISPLEIHPFLVNETRGFVRAATPLTGTMNVDVEDNDTFFSHFIVKMRDSVKGTVTGYALLAFDDSWNETGTLGEFSRASHPESAAKPYLVNFNSETIVDENTCPYGTFKLGLQIQTTTNGSDQTWLYRIPDRTVTHSPETNLAIVNARSILANGDARQALAEILGRDNVTVDEENTPINIDDAHGYLTSLTNGTTTVDDEMRQDSGAVLAKITNKLVFNVVDSSAMEKTRCFNLPDEKTEWEIQLFWENHGEEFQGENRRGDGACQLRALVSGSVQNPAWSPDGKRILFTRFTTRYNEGPADLFIFSPESQCLKTLVSEGSGNVNLPGSVWNSNTRKIVFSSSREPHDEIYIIDEDGQPGDETKVTDRSGDVAYEPSFSPDGQWVVFESHREDVEENGVITRFKIDGSGPCQALTGVADDCRQPNWSPAGNFILYQKFSGGQWDIYVINPDGTNPLKITSGEGDKTDASFSPDGQWIVYSTDNGELEFANLYILPVAGGSPVRVTNFPGYDGAPSWSPDGKKIVFESCSGDPDESAGTTIWVIDVPAH